MKLKVALATNNGKNFSDGHFGEADKYYIYEFDNNNYKYLKSIENNSIEEKKHADPKKAKSIITLLKKEGVQIVCNLKFGANISRVKKKLVPVITSKTSLDDGLEELIANHEQLIQLWNVGKKREYLNLK